MNHFTKLYDEECLYSVKARLLRDSLYYYSGGLSYLGCVRSIAVDIELPCNLEKLFCDTSHLVPWTIDSIIFNHTLFPFYKAFLSTDKHDIIMNAMRGSGMDVHLLAGIKASSLERSRLPLFCPECSKSDILCNGEPYFRRIHQIPNIQICPDHECHLIQYDPCISKLNGVQYYALSETDIADSAGAKNDCRVLLQVASEFKSILKLGCPFIYKDVDYKAFISSKGYFVGGKLLRSEINDEFLKYYDDVRNEYLKSRIKESYTWIGQLILNPQCVLNPFQHILFKRFSDSLSPRFVFKKAHPFGEGPWLCFNKVCEHYMTASINELKIEYGRNRKLVGVFTCTCGMTYTRVYSLKENKEKFEIRNRGGLWMSTFDLYYKQGMTPKEIARNLGTNASVITMHIKRKSLDFVVQRKRRQWKKISRGLGYTQARINEPSLYKWLFRNDRDWLLSTKLNKKNENLAQLRLNWEVIDESLSEEITIAIEEIGKTDGRVSKTLIAKIVTYGRYIHCGDLKKLPKTKALLEQKTESTEDYHLRKIDSIAKGISSEGASISKWKVLKRAGIKRPSTIELEKLNLLLKNNH